jgi:hypothetical protein
MLLNGKCPYCKDLVQRVNLANVTVVASKDSWVGVSYSCASCGIVLSIAIDPVALKSDLEEELLRARDPIKYLEGGNAVSVCQRDNPTVWTNLIRAVRLFMK